MTKPDTYFGDTNGMECARVYIDCACSTSTKKKICFETFHRAHAGACECVYDRRSACGRHAVAQRTTHAATSYRCASTVSNIYRCAYACIHTLAHTYTHNAREMQKCRIKFYNNMIHTFRYRIEIVMYVGICCIGILCAQKTMFKWHISKITCLFFWFYFMAHIHFHSLGDCWHYVFISLFLVRHFSLSTQ